MDEAPGDKGLSGRRAVQLHFQLDRLQGDALIRALVHMGQHVADLRKPARRPKNPAYVLEYNAWMATAIAAITSGQKYLTLPGAYQVWNITWPAVSATTSYRRR